MEDTFLFAPHCVLCGLEHRVQEEFAPIGSKYRAGPSPCKAQHVCVECTSAWVHARGAQALWQGAFHSAAARRAAGSRRRPHQGRPLVSRIALQNQRSKHGLSHFLFVGKTFPKA